MLHAMTEGKDQAFINVQNNIATSHKEDPSRGFEMIKAKMNIKFDDRHARRTASATRQVHPPSKENPKCYQQVHHPSKENAKCYQQRVSPSTSQESSISEHYHFEHYRAPRKSVTSSATAVTVHSKSEYESGTEGHHQDVPISRRLSQLFESSPAGYLTPEDATSSSMSRAGISIRKVMRLLRVQDSDHISAYLSEADSRATSMPLLSERKEVLLIYLSSHNMDVDEESDKECDRSQLSDRITAGDQGSTFSDNKVEDDIAETKLGLFLPRMPCATTIYQLDITCRFERADQRGNDRNVFKNSSTFHLPAGRYLIDRRSMGICDDLHVKTLLLVVPLLVQRLRQSVDASTSTQGTVEKTRMDQSTYQSEESEQSESAPESDGESIETSLRAEQVPKDIRQGNGSIVELGPGVFSPTMPKFTSIRTRQPSYRTYGDHDCIVISCDEITGMQYLHNAISDVTEKPTKKRHQGTAVKDNQPYESKAYEKAVVPYRREISKLYPGFVPTDAHGSGGPHIKLRDTGPGDM
jgi:hypothetical protein